METSSNKRQSKSNRRRISNFNEMSPLRNSVLNATSSSIMENIISDNDDDAERARRRSTSQHQKRISNIFNRSGSDSESCAISEASLDDHFETCVKLFTANKINTKNAWNLHIIEFMMAMLKKGLVMRETLKLASTSLDIGSKIYGLRVDDIHSDMLKLATSMARIHVDLDLETNEESDNNEMEPTSNQKNEMEKKKRKQTYCDDITSETMIAKDENSLNSDVAVHNTQYTGATISEKDKLYTISMFSKQTSGWEQLVNCRTNFKYWDHVSEKQIDNIEPVRVNIPEAIGTLCPSFLDFTIDKWSPGDDESLTPHQFPSTTDQIVYDENGLPMPELDSSDEEINNFDNFDEDAARFANNKTLVTDMRPVAGPSSDKELQYSYRETPVINDRFTIGSVWAGPAHWKIKCLQRRRSALGSLRGQKERRLQRIGPQPVNFDSMLATNFEEQFVPSKKKITRSRNLLRPLESFTLPEDMGITINDMCSLNLRPWLMKPIGGTEAMRLEAASAANLDISTVYQYDNPNDADYCSQSLVGNDDNLVDELKGNDDIALDFTQQEFSQNVIPNMFTPYVAQAKKMDMRKLKDAVWKSLTIVNSGDDNVENEDQRSETKLENVSFDEVYKILPNHMSTRMGEELSYPLAFVALLHLANEQTLKLEGQSDLLDVHISTDTDN